MWNVFVFNRGLHWRSYLLLQFFNTFIDLLFYADSYKKDVGLKDKRRKEV